MGRRADADPEHRGVLRPGGGGHLNGSLAVYRAETEEGPDVLRWLDRQLIRLVTTSHTCHLHLSAPVSLLLSQLIRLVTTSHTCHLHLSAPVSLLLSQLIRLVTTSHTCHLHLSAPVSLLLSQLIRLVTTSRT
ncbi:hypothetical protein WMY93_032899 [Mugilogobius chulae]|uniref:Uncharacterized protein n=1 Tax=Mugilogobius chulae TaxID=88201 RepID=A0AAW0MUD9_9GOBI